MVLVILFLKAASFLKQDLGQSTLFESRVLLVNPMHLDGLSKDIKILNYKNVIKKIKLYKGMIIIIQIYFE